MVIRPEVFARASEALQQSPIFSDLAPEEKEEFLNACRYQIISPDTLLFSPGDDCRNLYFIISGRIKMQEVDPDTGRNLVLFLLSSGDIFDFICLLDGGPHSLEAVSLDRCELLALPIATMHRFIGTNLNINKALLPYLGQKMRQLANLAAELSLSDTATRLQLLLLRHIQGDPPERIPRLIHDLSHEDIAGLIGTVRVVVNRHIQHLKKEGILQTHRKFIAIRDLKALLHKVESRFRFPGKKSS